MIKTLLSGRRGYWVGMGACVVALLLLLIFWTVPALLRMRKAQSEWNLQITALQQLGNKAGQIPSLESLNKQRVYRKYVSDQAEIVKRFFADRTTLLEAPLTGQGQTTPSEFEDAYVDATTRQRAWLSRIKGTMNVQDLQTAFVSYPWTTSVEVTPNPSEYLTVLRDYWARVHLYTILYNAQATTVKKLEVRGVAPVNSLFDGLPFDLDVTLPAERVTRLLDQMVTVSPSLSNKPAIRLQRVTLQQDFSESRLMVNVRMEGVILLLRKDVTKAGGPT